METRSMSRLSRRLGPLEIPCILQQVLQYLPHSDLKKSRLVCSSFNEEARRIVRKRSKIVLNNSKKLVACFLENCDEGSRFCDCVELVNLNVLSPSINCIFRRIGNDIKSLELRDSKWSCAELEDILTCQVPNLRELAINGSLPAEPTRILRIVEKKLPLVKFLNLQIFDKKTDEENVCQFVKDFLTATYNLEVLRSRDKRKWRNRKEKCHRLLFEILIDPEVQLRFPKLRRIEFTMSPWTDEQIKRLALKKFPLSYLNLAILPGISINALSTLLISLRSTLVKLKLSFTYWRYTTEFPCDMKLDKLQHLSLDWYNGSMRFVSFLKNLQTLILAQVDLNDIFTSQEVDKFCLPMKYLTRLEVYQHAEAVVLPQTVGYLADVFPSVKTLVLGKLNDDSIKEVFKRYSELEEFSAIEGLFSDSGISGIDDVSCKKCDLKHVKEIGRGDKGYYNEALFEKARNGPYIGDLTRLRKLELRSPNLTNLSIIHGVIDCENLRSLSLWCFELTYRSLKKLLKSLSLDFLEIQKVVFTHKSEVQFAVSTMKGKSLILNGLEAPKNSSMLSDDVIFYINQFTEVIRRSFIQQNPIAHSQQRLLLIYEACMAENSALYGLLNLCQ